MDAEAYVANVLAEARASTDNVFTLPLCNLLYPDLDKVIHVDLAGFDNRKLAKAIECAHETLHETLYETRLRPALRALWNTYDATAKTLRNVNDEMRFEQLWVACKDPLGALIDIVINDVANVARVLVLANILRMWGTERASVVMRFVADDSYDVSDGSAVLAYALNIDYARFLDGVAVIRTRRFCLEKRRDIAALFMLAWLQFAWSTRNGDIPNVSDVVTKEARDWEMRNTYQDMKHRHKYDGVHRIIDEAFDAMKSPYDIATYETETDEGYEFFEILRRVVATNGTSSDMVILSTAKDHMGMPFLLPSSWWNIASCALAHNPHDDAFQMLCDVCGDLQHFIYGIEGFELIHPLDFAATVVRSLARLRQVHAAWHKIIQCCHAILGYDNMVQHGMTLKTILDHPDLPKDSLMAQYEYLHALGAVDDYGAPLPPPYPLDVLVYVYRVHKALYDPCDDAHAAFTWTRILELIRLGVLTVPHDIAARVRVMDAIEYELVRLAPHATRVLRRAQHRAARVWTALRRVHDIDQAERTVDASELYGTTAAIMATSAMADARKRPYPSDDETERASSAHVKRARIA